MNGTVCTYIQLVPHLKGIFLEHIMEEGDNDTRSQMIRIVKVCQLTGHGNCMIFTLWAMFR